MNERMILIVPAFSTTMFPIDPRRISDEVWINQSIYGAAVTKDAYWLPEFCYSPCTFFARALPLFQIYLWAS